MGGWSSCLSINPKNVIADGGAGTFFYPPFFFTKNYIQIGFRHFILFRFCAKHTTEK